MAYPSDLKFLFDKAGITLAVAESATAGNLSARIASVSGASTFFKGGAIVYNLDMKVKLLGVDREHAASCDCVSQQVARAMASGVRDLCGSTVGVSVTGYVSPWSGNGVVVTEPFAWLGFNVNGHAWEKKVDVDPYASRVEVQRWYAADAIDGITKYLATYEPTPNTPISEYESLRLIYERLRTPSA